MTIRASGRTPSDLRRVTFTRDYTEIAAGSVLVEFGAPRALCTASVEARIPPWLKRTGRGWVTAEYSMLPGSSPERVDREAARGKQSGRTQEIQRLIGRVLRAVTDLAAHAATSRSRSTATCSRPTAALARRRSAAAGSRSTTPAPGWSRPADCAAHPIARTVRGDLGRDHRRAADASTSTTPRTSGPRST